MLRSDTSKIYGDNYSKYSTAVDDKWDDFNFKIVNFPHLSSNIPSGPAYGVCISQLVRIGRICSDYHHLALRHYKLTERLIHQGFRYSDLCRAFRKFAKKHVTFSIYHMRKHMEDICLHSFISRHVLCRFFWWNFSDYFSILYKCAPIRIIARFL